MKSLVTILTLMLLVGYTRPLPKISRPVKRQV